MTKLQQMFSDAFAATAARKATRATRRDMTARNARRVARNEAARKTRAH